jgi:sulfur carrier protein
MRPANAPHFRPAPDALKKMVLNLDYNEVRKRVSNPPGEMQISLNGQTREVPEGQTVLALLESMGLDPARLAVELDGLILKKTEWAGRALAPGARLEVVHFVGGG